ncbi:hypothetical protein ACFW0K_004430 [Enterobacter hormaechei]|uniref:hypothetical protein n=1 Tax=Enterobacter TaxID=547 RepID=UPI0007A7F6D0|nr:MULTISPECIES: hypothetical protein [Enterobacter]MBJ6386362.1 hypothetical protein [Enterobacter cloacae]EKS6325419.1 hypothetical protein [Enterobacter hormaechei]MBJ6434776.1 hypothetical protein [Enterobacter cloacae]MBJ6487539.1 hypothetical protein [Enterobacter cloacae]MBJ6497863.1 hypothetical protein [Enterobacter cloacae]
MSNKTGGPAFPQSGVCTPEINSWDSEDFGGRGLTVRDYFAAKAMQAMIAAHEPQGAIPGWAYEMADEMLRAREAS